MPISGLYLYFMFILMCMCKVLASMCWHYKEINDYNYYYYYYYLHSPVLPNPVIFEGHLLFKQHFSEKLTMRNYDSFLETR